MIQGSERIGEESRKDNVLPLLSRGDSLSQSAFRHRLILAESFQVDNCGACFGSIDLNDLLLSLVYIAILA